MAFHHSPRIVTGTTFFMDVTNKKCYPGSGTTLTDMSNDKTITLTGGPTIQTVNATKVIDLDGTNDRIVITDPTYPSVNFSVEHWQKFKTLNGASNTVQYMWQMGPLSNGNGGTLVQAKFDSDHNSFANRLYYHWGGSYTNTNVTVTDLNWHQYMTTVSGTSVKLYIDGIFQETLTAPSNISPSGTYEMGRYIDGNSHYNTSQIAINKFYDRTLTDAEVLQNYNAMAGRFS